MTSPENQTWLNDIKWNTDGLVPVIAQDFQTGDVLTQAWMNREALTLTEEEGRAVYWSRSRKKIWRKGEESGYQQIIKEIFLQMVTTCISVMKELIILKPILVFGIFRILIILLELVT